MSTATTSPVATAASVAMTGPVSIVGVVGCICSGRHRWRRRRSPVRRHWTTPPGKAPPPGKLPGPNVVLLLDDTASVIDTGWPISIESISVLSTDSSISYEPVLTIEICALAASSGDEPLGPTLASELPVGAVRSGAIGAVDPAGSEFVADLEVRAQ